MDFVQSPAFVFMTGILTSVGPCVAPRYLAVSAMADGVFDAKSTIRILAFVAGTLLAYLAIAISGSTVMRLLGSSSYVYLAFALVLMLFGLRVLVVSEHACHASKLRPGAGASFFLGLASSSVISPCCTPMLIAIGGLDGGAQHPLAMVGLVLAFTAGHLAPLAMAIASANVGVSMLSRFGPAVATVNAAVLLALSGYYALLA